MHPRSFPTGSSQVYVALLPKPNYVEQLIIDFGGPAQPGSIGWIAGFGQTGSAVLPLVTGALAEKAGIWTLHPL